MRLFRTVTGCEEELTMPKWCTFLFGIVLGVFFHEYLVPFVWAILAVAVVLAIRSVYVYFSESYPPHDFMMGA